MEATSSCTGRGRWHTPLQTRGQAIALLQDMGYQAITTAATCMEGAWAMQGSLYNYICRDLYMPCRDLISMWQTFSYSQTLDFSSLHTSLWREGINWKNEKQFQLCPPPPTSTANLDGYTLPVNPKISYTGLKMTDTFRINVQTFSDQKLKINVNRTIKPLLFQGNCHFQNDGTSAQEMLREKKRRGSPKINCHEVP